MQLKPDVEAIFEFVGYRRERLYEGYRPAHLIDENCLTTGIHNYFVIVSVNVYKACVTKATVRNVRRE